MNAILRPYKPMTAQEEAEWIERTKENYFLERLDRQAKNSTK